VRRSVHRVKRARATRGNAGFSAGVAILLRICYNPSQRTTDCVSRAALAQDMVGSVTLGAPTLAQLTAC
jgi:hypothetical protein